MPLGANRIAMIGAARRTEEDPYWNNVSLLLRGDGPDGSTNIVDSSSYEHAVSVYGDAQVDTAFKRYGTGSLLFDGTGDYLITADHPSLDFDTGAFTIEFWFYTNKTTRQDPLSRYQSPHGWGIGLSVSQTRDVLFYRYNSIVVSTPQNSWSVNTWTHVAVVRSGTTLRIYVDGSELASGTEVNSLNATIGVHVGIAANLTLPCDAHLDNIRITKGVARYTSNFTPTDY